MPDTQHQTSAEATIRELAARYKVDYTRTASDVLGHHITRLSGDTVALDEPALLLLALERAGHLTSAAAARLHGEYLRAKYE
jgi:hypothetical protein